MKNILTKVEFHYSFLIMALGLVLTGHFVNLLIFTSLILIHELGHVITSIIFNYKVDKIIIYPYGGLTKINTLVNTSIKKDLAVALSGILMQSIYFLIIYILYRNNIIRAYIYQLLFLYHKSMLVFNLLPIIPLDGFKILNLILSKFFNFNLSNNVSVFISLITIVLFLFSNLYEKNYSMVLVIGLLMKNIYVFYNSINYIYNRFLLERYLYDINYQDKKIITNVSKMYKNKSHLLIEDGKIIPEKKFLSEYFLKDKFKSK